MPDFMLKDASWELFDIKSLRSKVVYLDFWGSWCKPCLAQMPNSAIVQNKFKGKDVAFLFIDFYETNKKWLKTIKERKLKGIHVKAEKADEQYFDGTFGVKQCFPRYALLDKNGTLITSSAPHPNDEDAVLLIDKYLKLQIDAHAAKSLPQGLYDTTTAHFFLRFRCALRLLPLTDV